MRTCAQNCKSKLYMLKLKKIITFTQQFYGCHYSIVRLNSTFAAVFLIVLFFIVDSFFSPWIYHWCLQPERALYTILESNTLHKLTDTATLLMNTFFNLLWFNKNNTGSLVCVYVCVLLRSIRDFPSFWSEIVPQIETQNVLFDFFDCVYSFQCYYSICYSALIVHALARARKMIAL